MGAIIYDIARPAIRRLILGAFCLSAGLGCGSWRRRGTQDSVSPTETLTQLLNITAFYRQLGRLAGPEPVPFVGSVAFAAGQGDSVIALTALSMENRAFSFQRDGSGFAARYRVTLSFKRDGAPPLDVTRDEVVRVASFQETMRADESILFQQAVRLVPGSYEIAVTVRDAGKNVESNATSSFEVPTFGPRTTSAPILAYQATGRAQLGEPVSVVLNPRGSVAFGGDTLLAYIEGYDFPEGETLVPFEVRDQQDSVIYRDSLVFNGRSRVESQVVRLAPDSVALGELRLAVGVDSAARRDVSAVVSFSQAWVVTNYDDMIALLRYFGHDNQLGDLKDASAEERPELWREFWKETDPNRLTPENEAINQYFTRLAFANARFSDEGIAGWRTDRGEAFITLGPPDEVFDASPTSQGRIVRWNYIGYRLTLNFQDETGFGRFRMTPASRADFERVLARVRRQEG